MKNAKQIINNIIVTLPEGMRNNAYNILACRYLAQNTAAETAIILGLNLSEVVDVLQAVKMTCKVKRPDDFRRIPA